MVTHVVMSRQESNSQIIIISYDDNKLPFCMIYTKPKIYTERRVFGQNFFSNLRLGEKYRKVSGFNVIHYYIILLKSYKQMLTSTLFQDICRLSHGGGKKSSERG